MTPLLDRLNKQPEPHIPEWLKRAKAEANGRRFVARKDTTGRIVT